MSSSREAAYCGAISQRAYGVGAVESVCSSSEVILVSELRDWAKLVAAPIQCPVSQFLRLPLSEALACRCAFADPSSMILSEFQFLPSQLQVQTENHTSNCHIHVVLKS